MNSERERDIYYVDKEGDREIKRERGRKIEREGERNKEKERDRFLSLSYCGLEREKNCMELKIYEMGSLNPCNPSCVPLPISQLPKRPNSVGIHHVFASFLHLESRLCSFYWCLGVFGTKNRMPQPKNHFIFIQAPFIISEARTHIPSAYTSEGRKDKD